MNPLAIDLFCGLGGWTEGLLAEGWTVIGFDIVRWSGYRGQLAVQDVLTIHGSQFRHASLIVASPPCTEYSYRSMPWKRAKAMPPPDNALFDACFRIQREACEAAGRLVPMVVENVRGAQAYVGRARWRYGSYYLWGDVPALMPRPVGATKIPGMNWNYSSEPGYRAEAFNTNCERRRNHWCAESGFKRDGQYNRIIWTPEIGEDKDGYVSHGIRCRNQRHARAVAAQHIAKVPMDLARYIARVFKP